MNSRKSIHWGLAASLALLAGVCSGEATLKTGDAAPPLKVKQWVKGQPLTGFERGQAYIVEFWATWCGPCIKAMPHLTALAHEYAGKVTVCGISVYEMNNESVTDPVAKVREFMKANGHRMGYAVGVDSGVTHDMEKNWLKAADVSGIPATFVIDQQGRIAWIGHPGNVDEVIAQVVAGTWNIAAYAAFDSARDSIESQIRARDYQGALKSIAAAQAKLPGKRLELLGLEFTALLHTDEAAAADLVERNVEVPGAMSAGMADAAAQLTITPGLAKRTYAAGAKAIQGFVDGMPQKVNMSSTLRYLGELYYKGGEYDRAVKTQEKLIEYESTRNVDLLKADPAVRDTWMRRYQDGLQMYKAARTEAAQERRADPPAADIAEVDLNAIIAALQTRAPAGMTPLERARFTEKLDMEVRARALAFLAEYPKDPRRWTVVFNLVSNRPLFVLEWGAPDASGAVKPARVDEAAAAAWRGRVETLRAQMETATDLSEHVKRIRAVVAGKAAKGKAFEARWQTGQPVPAPDFTAYTLDNKPVKISDYRGKVVVLDFWASWCGHCIEGMPHMNEIAGKYKEQGLVVLASGTSEARANFERFMKANEGKYPNLVFSHDKEGTGEKRASAALYGVAGLPTQFVIDRQGRVVGADAGASGQWLNEALAKAGIKVDKDKTAD